jgi:SH3-like domain-containing protein
MSVRLVPFLLVCLLLLSAGSRAADRVGRITGQPLPRFVSLKSSQVNLRAGPGQQYPVDWVLMRKFMPVEVLDEFDVWRKVRDFEGTEGWVHQSFLQARRSVVVTGATRALKASDRIDASTVAMAEPGVIGRLQECREDWCRVDIAGTKGWLKRSEFWGVYPDETVK